MKSISILPFKELNNSFNNKLVTIQGIVREISPEYEDNSYGFIQSAIIQGFNDKNQKFEVQRDIDIILLEDHIGLISEGDKVQITGIQEVHVTNNRQIGKSLIVARDIEIINDKEYLSLNSQHIDEIKIIAKYDSVQQKIANFIFDQIPLEDEIKLIGTLILFCTDLPAVVKKKVHSRISLLIIGTSGTYKTKYLKNLKELFPNNNFQFSQKSDQRFISYYSRYKKGRMRCKRAGLADFAKNGIILIDNLEELKEYRLSKLNENFTEILKKTSIISAAHTKYDKYYDNTPIYENVQFPRKNSLLEKFDIVLVIKNKHGKVLDHNEVSQEDRDNLSNVDLQLTKDLLRNYIVYAKKRYDPIITKEASDRIIEFKEEILNINKKKEKIRNVSQQKLVRVLTILCKLYARIALKNEITVSDVQRIIEIYKKSLSNQDLI